jgi:hypothetical protein
MTFFGVVMVATQDSEAPAHLCQVLVVDQRIGPDNGAGAGNTTLDIDMCDEFLYSKNCYNLNHVMIIWIK